MRRALLTGGTGLIGSALVKHLVMHGCHVVMLVRDVARAQSEFLSLNAADKIRYIDADLSKGVVPDIDEWFDCVIHAASPASPELFVNAPIETMMANIYGARGLLEYARRNGVGKFVFVSSSEVYGKAPPRPDGYKEDDYGFVDILDVRSSYPMGKRAAETLCVSYAKEYGLNVSIVRPGHIYGPTASPKDKRVSSAFAWAAARGETLVLKSSGASLRSYTHADDCASAILAVVEKGKSGEAYNIANPNGVCSIRQMAEIMADEGGVELRMEVANADEKGAFNPMNNSCLDTSKIESLGWRGQIVYEEGFRRTVNDIKERIRNGAI